MKQCPKKWVIIYMVELHINKKVSDSSFQSFKQCAISSFLENVMVVLLKVDSVVPEQSIPMGANQFPEVGIDSNGWQSSIS